MPSCLCEEAVGKLNCVETPHPSVDGSCDVEDSLQYVLDLVIVIKIHSTLLIFSFMCSHIPHVMTLFDRRVDLARFSPDTPLYVMCREWMSNNPQKLPSSNAGYEPHPTDKPLPSQPPSTLPPPIPLSKDSRGVAIRLDIPKPHPPHVQNQQDLDLILHQVWNSLPEVCGLNSGGRVVDSKHLKLDVWVWSGLTVGSGPKQPWILSQTILWWRAHQAVANL